GWMYARRLAWADELPLETATPPVFAAPPPQFTAPPPVSRPSPPVFVPPPSVPAPTPTPVFAPQAPPLEDFSPFDFDDEPQVIELAVPEPVVVGEPVSRGL